MRTLIMTGLVLVSMGANARNMFVVVHTQDTEVIEYRRNCSSDPGGEGMVVRRVVRVQGHVNWHVVGGLAPYTVINGVPDEVGNFCVTVIDAAGNIASGCGIIGTQVAYETVDCPPPAEVVVSKVVLAPAQVQGEAEVHVRPPNPRVPHREDREQHIDRIAPEKTTTTSRAVVSERVTPTAPPGRTNPVERQVPRK